MVLPNFASIEIRKLYPQNAECLRISVRYNCQRCRAMANSHCRDNQIRKSGIANSLGSSYGGSCGLLVSSPRFDKDG
jgi:hypothetical protein